MDFGTNPLSLLARIDNRRTPTENTVLIDHKGKIHQALWYVEKDTLTVSYGTSQIVTSLGQMSPATLARMILRVIVAGNPEARSSWRDGKGPDGGSSASSLNTV